MGCHFCLQLVACSHIPSALCTSHITEFCPASTYMQTHAHTDVSTIRIDNKELGKIRIRNNKKHDLKKMKCPQSSPFLSFCTIPDTLGHFCDVTNERERESADREGDAAV